MLLTYRGCHPRAVDIKAISGFAFTFSRGKLNTRWLTASEGGGKPYARGNDAGEDGASSAPTEVPSIVAGTFYGILQTE